MEVSVTINGAVESLGKGSTVLDVLNAKKARPEMMAVEINGELLRKDDYSVTTLNDGDRMEFLPYMAGGGSYS